MIFNLIEEWQVPAKGRVTRSPDGSIVIPKVKLLGARSRNRNADGSHNVYPEATRKAAIPLYEGAAVFLDHKDPNSRRERSYRDKLGRIRRVVSEADGLYAQLVINPRHPEAEKIAWDAEYSPDSLGMSHDARGRGVVKNGEHLVEEIVSVASVDIVHMGATTRGLFEAEGPNALATVQQQMADLRAQIKQMEERDRLRIGDRVAEGRCGYVLLEGAGAAEFGRQMRDEGEEDAKSAHAFLESESGDPQGAGDFGRRMRDDAW